MTVPHSDALVLFGASGDLAFKKIFPALQSMVRRGQLTVSIVGVAKSGWNLEQMASMPPRCSEPTRQSTSTSRAPGGPQRLTASPPTWWVAGPAIRVRLILFLLTNTNTNSDGHPGHCRATQLM